MINLLAVIGAIAIVSAVIRFAVWIGSERERNKKTTAGQPIPIGKDNSSGSDVVYTWKGGKPHREWNKAILKKRSPEASIIPPTEVFSDPEDWYLENRKYFHRN